MTTERSLAVDLLSTPVPRQSRVDFPVDGSFDVIARMAATIFRTPMATVSIVDTDRVRFLAAVGLEGIDQVGTEPGLSASAVLEPGPYLVTDAVTDPRTADHPLVRGQLGLRFYAAAPIVLSDGQALGTVDVIDRKRHRRVTQTQLGLLADLAAAAAVILQTKLSCRADLRAERNDRADEDLRRETHERLLGQMTAAAQALAKRERPAWCQLGGDGCRQPAQLKVADSWGDSAWGCWEHAEDALFNVPSVFLAVESATGLEHYRRRAAEH